MELEQTLKKIIELDEAAEKYEKQCEEMKDKLKKRQEEKLQQMNIEMNTKIKNYEREITAEKLQMAEIASKKITESKYETLKKMKMNYRDRKEMIVKEIFNLVIKESG